MLEEPREDGVSIHTGFPNPALDKSLDNLDLQQLLIPRPISSFLFRIAGDQWEDVGIFDGDIAIIDRALSAGRQDIVVWWDETAGDFGVSRCKDMPEHSSMWGVVTATIHQLRSPL